MQAVARSMSCVAIVLAALAAPAAAQQRGVTVGTPTLQVPRTTLVPLDVTRTALVPAVVQQSTVVAATNAVAPRVIATPAAATSAISIPTVGVQAIGSARSFDAPRVEVMPRTQPGALSRPDARPGHD